MENQTQNCLGCGGLIWAGPQLYCPLCRFEPLELSDLPAQEGEADVGEDLTHLWIDHGEAGA